MRVFWANFVVVEISLTQRYATSVFRCAKTAGPFRRRFPAEGKTVASPNELIVEIISPFAFTFKIPFH
jgi:hypothetical protein